MTSGQIASRAPRGRVTTALVVSMLGLAGSWLRAQDIQKVPRMAPTAHPSFEVATVKRSAPDDKSHRFNIEGRRILVENQTVGSIMEVAFGVHPKQILNLPTWADTQRFDVQGVPDQEGEPNVVQFREMLRKLLADRFGLQLHTEQREMDRYAMRIAKGGPKLERTKSAPDTLPSINGTGTKTTTSLKITNVSMEDLAQELQDVRDRPVVDETGLRGRFDCTLSWTRDDAPTEDADNSVPGFFTAIQEQLGLKLEPSRGQVNVLVVDKLALPSAN